LKGSALKNTAIEIYSQSQLPKGRRGVKIMKNNSKTKYNNDSLSKLKQELKNTTLNFYECFKTKQSKMKQK
jgi:hypothetical protein